MQNPCEKQGFWYTWAMSPKLGLLVRWLLVFVIALGLAGFVAVRYLNWRWTQTRLTITAAEDAKDRTEYPRLQALYATVSNQALIQRNAQVCDQLPTLFLPYRRDANSQVQYMPSQRDGAHIPDRFYYWPRAQCIYRLALTQDPTVCTKAFPAQEDETNCTHEIELARSEDLKRFDTLAAYPQTGDTRIGLRSFYSSSSKRSLPYFIFYPDQAPKGILIYLHGAGGGMEQGVLDDSYLESFKKLKGLLKTSVAYIYITPTLTDFGRDGGQDANDLAKALKVTYPDLPVYVAGASAGGRTLFYALEAPDTLFQGGIALCPAVDREQVSHEWSNAPHRPLWIVQGVKDQLLPFAWVDGFVQHLKAVNYRLTYITLPDGDHGAPIDQIDWPSALNFIQNK